MLQPDHEPIEVVLSRLENVRRSGPSRWTARCPAHDDRNPSLSVKVGEDRRVLIYCHAGCSIEEILEAIDLTLKNLFPANAPEEPFWLAEVRGGATSSPTEPTTIAPPLDCIMRFSHTIMRISNKSTHSTRTLTRRSS